MLANDAPTPLSSLLGSLGHELQNAMGVIISGVELISENTDNKDIVLKYCNLIQAATFKLSDISKTLLKYGHTVSENKHPFLLNTLITDIHSLAHAECRKKGINPSYKLDATHLIHGDSSSLFQALLGIFLYALDSSSKTMPFSISSINQPSTVVLVVSAEQDPPTPHTQSITQATHIISAHNGTLEHSKHPENGWEITLTLPALAQQD